MLTSFQACTCPPTAADFSPACRLTEPDEPVVYPIRRFSTSIYALDLHCPETGMYTGCPRPLPYDTVLGGLEPIPAVFPDFRTFGPLATISAQSPAAVHLICDNTRSFPPAPILPVLPRRRQGLQPPRAALSRLLASAHPAFRPLQRSAQRATLVTHGPPRAVLQPRPPRHN